MKVGLKDFKRPDGDFTHLINLDPPTGADAKKPSAWSSIVADIVGLLTLFGLGWLAMVVL